MYYLTQFLTQQATNAQFCQAKINLAGTKNESFIRRAFFWVKNEAE